MILHYFKKKENTQKIIVENLYKNILLESNLFLNQNSFFKEKNYKTSFEIVSMLIILHIKKNIKYKIKNYKLINEEIINIFILDLDESLRAKGIGDMSIGKYVKSYVKKFYFRLAHFPGNIDKIKIEEFSKYLKLFDFIIENKEIEASKEFLILLDKTSAHIK